MDSSGGFADQCRSKSCHLHASSSLAEKGNCHIHQVFHFISYSSVLLFKINATYHTSFDLLTDNQNFCGFFLRLLECNLVAW